MVNFFGRFKKKKNIIDDLRARGAIIGKNVDIINSNIDFGHAFLLEVGDDVTITNSTILTHDASTKKFLSKTKVGKVIIGSRVFVGLNSIILPNVKIGNDVIIGAGSIVTKNIPSNSLVVGNPARIIGKVSDYIEKNKSNMKKVPVYNTYWMNKTEKEKQIMQKELSNTIGYDE